MDLSGQLSRTVNMNVEYSYCYKLHIVFSLSIL